MQSELNTPMDTELIFRVIKNRSTEAERTRLIEWRNAASENEQAFQEFARVLAESAAAEDSLPQPRLPSRDVLVKRAEERLKLPVTPPPRRRSFGKWSKPGLAAAALVVVGFSVAELRDRDPTPPTFTPDAFATGPDERATVSLLDGTVVRLAPESRLKLTRGHQREVTLVGRAYFAVASDPDRPFRVRTPSGDIEVLGTRFDLAAQPERLRVVVVQGRVALSANGQRRDVGAGEASGVYGAKTLPVVRAPDIASVLDWVGDFLAFESTPLRDAANEIERQYGVTIEIADSSLARRTVDAWFADRPIEEVMEVLCAILGARYSMDDGVITIRR